MDRERTYEFKVEIETIEDIIWFTAYDELIVNGFVIDDRFWNEHNSKELREFREQKVSDHKFVEFPNGRVVALVQIEEKYF